MLSSTRKRCCVYRREPVRCECLKSLFVGKIWLKEYLQATAGITHLKQLTDSIEYLKKNVLITNWPRVKSSRILFSVKSQTDTYRIDRAINKAEV